MLTLPVKLFQVQSRDQSKRWSFERRKAHGKKQHSAKKQIKKVFALPAVASASSAAPGLLAPVQVGHARRVGLNGALARAVTVTRGETLVVEARVLLILRGIVGAALLV